MDTNTLAPPTLPPDRAADGAAMRVAIGADLFASLCPDWADRINTDTLDVRDPNTCPLAQVIDMISVPQSVLDRWDRPGLRPPTSYAIGLAAIPTLRTDLPPNWPAHLGFERSYDSWRDVAITYEALTAAWLVEIQRRRTVTA